MFKKFIKWYLKMCVVVNGVSVLAAFLIGNMVRAKWIKNEKILWHLCTYNDCMMLNFKTQTKKGLFKDWDC